MNSSLIWKSGLRASERYDNVQRLKQSIETTEPLSTARAYEVARSAEIEAYTSSASRVGGRLFLPADYRLKRGFIIFSRQKFSSSASLEAYDALCQTSINMAASNPYHINKVSSLPAITIGSYPECHIISNGLVSEVFRSTSFALKVITETRNVEPHNAAREVKILNSLSHPSIITLKETFQDQSGRLVLVFPYQPLTLADVINTGPVPETLIRQCFHGVFSGLAYLHGQSIIHRDIKPSNILLSNSTGTAYICDFGTAWHPSFSAASEPTNRKVLEVGTTCYRAPETLFGNRTYVESLDIWATGTMLAECLRKPPKPLFESRGSEEDGNQLGLILSMFKTLGTPTIETWPEARTFNTPPFEWYQEFPGRSWEDLIPAVDAREIDLIRKTVCYESGWRLTAQQAFEHPFFNSCK